MLEYKNTSVRLSSGGLSKPFSLVVEPGDVVCVCGATGAGKSNLLMATMGLRPVEKGFITLDGELITPGAGAYFRKMMAYVPQDLPRNELTVRELFHTVADAQPASVDASEDKLFKEWQWVGIDKAVADKRTDELGRDALQLVLLSFIPLLNKKIVLIDNLIQDSHTAAVVSRLAEEGAEIIFTCREMKMTCNKVVYV